MRAPRLSMRAPRAPLRYLEPVREPEFELEAAAPVDWDDIETADLTRANLQRAVMTDVRVFHPERAAAVAPACVEPDVQSRPAPERRSGDREPGLVETK